MRELDAIAARIEGKTYTPADLALLVAEVERLRDDNHALQAEIILTMEHHERIREAVARHRVQILDGGHPLAEDVTLWAVLDA